MTRKPVIVTAVVVIALIGALLILPNLLNSNNSETSEEESETQSAQQQAREDRLSVRAYIAESRDFTNNIFTTGTVRADEYVILRPEVSGRITRIYFDEGQEAKEGELLLKINDSDLLAEYKRAEYRKNLAEIRERRFARLVEMNATAQEEYDTALNELNVIKAEMELIQSRIDKTEIRAPFDGIVGLKYVSEGSYITPTTEIAAFQNLDPVKIDFSVPERYSGSVQAGQQFRFSRQGSENSYTGRVYAIESRVDAETRTLALRGTAPNRDRRILPGMFVEVSFNLSTMENTVLIPSEAIIPELGGQRIFVYEDGRAVSRSIEIGVRTDTRVQVTDGLAPGDTVITTGMLQLRSGMPVRIAEFRGASN